MPRVEGEVEEHRLLAVILAHIECERIQLIAASQSDQLESRLANVKIVIVLLVRERHIEKLPPPQPCEPKRVLHVVDRRALVPVAAPQLLTDMRDEIAGRGSLVHIEPQ